MLQGLVVEVREPEKKDDDISDEDEDDKKDKVCDLPCCVTSRVAQSSFNNSLSSLNALKIFKMISYISVYVHVFLLSIWGHGHVQQCMCAQNAGNGCWGSCARTHTKKDRLTAKYACTGTHTYTHTHSLSLPLSLLTHKLQTGI